MQSENRTTEDLETRLLLEGIRLRYGYDLRHYAPASIRRRVRYALSRTGFDHLGELQHAILSDPDLFGKVMDDLLVQVTELFRDPLLYLVLRREVVPILRTYPTVRVWHAGCASGEEVYSTAIVLEETGLYDRCEMFASDLRAAALVQAGRGMYGRSLLDEASANYEKAGGTSSFGDYCLHAYEHFTMRERLRRNLFLFQHDLVSDEAFGQMQVVFCRNVLIYFDRELRGVVLRKIAQSLRPGGFLCLGASERLSAADLEAGFVDFSSEARIYRYAPESRLDAR